MITKLLLNAIALAVLVHDDTHAAAAAANDLTQSVAICRAAASSSSSTSNTSGGTGMISTANPTATQVGLAILEAGGTAVDAMVAVQAVLGLVEPQSSGLGGGSFAVSFRGIKNSRSTLKIRSILNCPRSKAF